MKAMDSGFLLTNLEMHLRRHAPLNHAKLVSFIETIRNSMDGYDWVGFYWLNPQNEQELLLGSFSGEPTDHIRIPINKGICGMAASKGETIIVDDVTKANEYIACSIKVKSEIVTPIFLDGKVVGEIDVDSHQAARFTETDKTFLEAAGQMLARHLTLEIINDDCKSSAGA